MVGDAIADHEAAAAHGLAFVGRVPAGRSSPFPAGTRLVADMAALAAAVASLYLTKSGRRERDQGSELT